ncbi:MAG: CsbD family protein [Chloroflexi bacterium]|nr:CsbD family protein [Chloroflexota bacterium]
MSTRHDVLKGSWKQLRGQLKEWWGELTEDDVIRIDGQRDKLIGALQMRYGWTRDRAEMEIDRRLLEYANAQKEPMR